MLSNVTGLGGRIGKYATLFFFAMACGAAQGGGTPKAEPTDEAPSASVDSQHRSAGVITVTRRSVRTATPKQASATESRPQESGESKAAPRRTDEPRHQSLDAKRSAGTVTTARPGTMRIQATADRAAPNLQTLKLCRVSNVAAFKARAQRSAGANVKSDDR